MHNFGKELGLVLGCTTLAMACGAVALCVVAPSPSRFVTRLPVSKTVVASAVELPSQTGYWSFEDATARDQLPEFKTIPAARPNELTPSNGYPDVVANRDQYTQWYRSHGDATSSRYSLLDQIRRENVAQLKMAWTYHSEDGAGNIQCNPIIVDGVMFAPTVGNHVVAVDAVTGDEMWRINPEGKPAFRGLVYWPGDETNDARVILNAGEALLALHPDNGDTIFRTPMPEARAAGAVFENVLVVPGYLRDVYGLSLIHI